MTKEKLDRLESLVGSKNYDDVDELWNALPDLIWAARKGADCDICLSKQQEQVRALADENAAKDATIRKLHLLNDTEVEVKREMREKLAAKDEAVVILEGEAAEKDARIAELEALIKKVQNVIHKNLPLVKVEDTFLFNESKRYLLLKEFMEIIPLEGSDQDGHCR